MKAVITLIKKSVKHWALIASIGILWITVTVLVILSLRQNQEHLIYAHDDAYIHMAIAKNFAQEGVWGVTKYNFTSSSSSLLHTLLLSFLYSIFGVNEISPLILNIIFATFTVCLIYIFLKRYKFLSLYILVILFLIIFSTPLPGLILTGMEHILHTLLTISFVYLSAQILSGDKTTLKYQLLLILASLVTMARYEGLFLILVVCALFAIKKQLSYSLLLGGLAIIPIAIYGMISILNGWYFLPNPLVLKGNFPTFSLMGMGIFFYNAAGRMVISLYIFIPVLLALLLFILQFDKHKTLWKNSLIMLAIFIATTLLHILFADVVDWFFRYEAYLVTLSIFVIAIGLREYLPEKLSIDVNKVPKYVAITLLVLLGISPLVNRSARSLSIALQATTNTYEQPYQVGLFLKQFYEGESIALHDIGAVNYLADIKCLDLWGLGSLEVAKAQIEGNYDTRQIYNLARQKKAKIGIILYDYWVREYCEIPSQWSKVGEWKILNNVAYGDETVSFYAVDPEEESKLSRNLRLFSSQLPRNVEQRGRYIDEGTGKK